MTTRSNLPAGCIDLAASPADPADQPNLTDRMRRRHEAWLERRRAFARRVGVPLERLPSMIIPPRCVAAGPMTEALERDGVLINLEQLQRFAQLEARAPQEARRLDTHLRAQQSKFPALAIAAALVR